jgi:hypothetical protein
LRCFSICAEGNLVAAPHAVSLAGYLNLHQLLSVPLKLGPSAEDVHYMSPAPTSTSAFFTSVCLRESAASPLSTTSSAFLYTSPPSSPALWSCRGEVRVRYSFSGGSLLRLTCGPVGRGHLRDLCLGDVVKALRAPKTRGGSAPLAPNVCGAPTHTPSRPNP